MSVRVTRVQIALTSVDILVVGSAPSALGDAISDFERRLSKHVKVNVRELKGERLDRGAEQVRAAEGARISDALAGIARSTSVQPFVVACDINGTTMSSERLADRLLTQSRLVVIVGGACGLAPELLDRADLRLSFGPMTLPHGMARLVLTEQLYRAHKIAHGEPYHH